MNLQNDLFALLFNSLSGIFQFIASKNGFIVFDDLHWTDSGKKTTQKAAKYLQQYCTEIEQITDELGNFFVILQKN